MRRVRLRPGTAGGLLFQDLWLWRDDIVVVDGEFGEPAGADRLADGHPELGVAPLQGLADLGGWRSGGMVATLPRGCRVEGSRGLGAGATGSCGTRRHGCGWDGLPRQKRPDSTQRITTAVMPVSAILSSMGNFLPPALRRLPATRPCRQDGGACRRLGGNKAVLTLCGQWSSGTPTHRRTAGFPGQAVPAEEPHPSANVSARRASQGRYLRAGSAPAPIAMNCSGKHAAMIATCAVAGWPTTTYRDPGHPLQVAIRRVLEDMAGERIAATAVDGCGAPLYAVSLVGLARCYRAMALAEPGSHERLVADAIRRHPEWVSGSRRIEARLLRSLPGRHWKEWGRGLLRTCPPRRALAGPEDRGR